MSKVLKIAVVDKDCVACGSCVKACPGGAIQIRAGVIAYVDTEKCVGCGMCAKICPAAVINIAEREAE